MRYEEPSSRAEAALRASARAPQFAHRQTHVGFARGYGIADPATNVPTTPGRLFRIASVTKPLTAVAVFRLIELGRFRLSDGVIGPAGILAQCSSTPS